MNIILALALKRILTPGRLFCILLVGLFSIANAQLYSGSIIHDGHIRTYKVFLPQNYQSNMPVIFTLTGYTGTGQWIMNYSLMNDVADTAGFLAVYPEPVQPGWNSGIIDRPTPNVDDVGFITELIDTLYAHYNIDKSRVYCCGFSNGGHMAQRLAYWAGHRFAAVASICGTMTDSTAVHPPAVPRLMPILILSATADPALPWDGDLGKFPIDDMLDFWIQNNNCALTADTISLPDLDSGDNCTVDKISYTNCLANVQILFYKVINGGHAWPGGDKDVWGGNGNMNMDISASIEMWNFFKNYTNPYADMAYGKSIEMTAYVPPSGEIVFMTAEVANPENHEVIVYGMINNKNGAFKDSIQLFDDGLHNDGAAADNVWAGSKWVVPGQEEIFEVGLHTSDLVEETEHYLHLDALRYFTTIGPVVFTDTTHIDGVWTDDRYRTQYLKLKFSNHDASRTATNLKVKMETNDPRVKSVDKNLISVNDIAPGKEQWSAETYFNYANSFGPDSTIGNPIRFVCTIYSNGYPFWKDTLDYVTPVEKLEIPHFPLKFRLDQNYPNPFNPSTTIQFQIPNSQFTTLKVYDILGKEVSTLVSMKLNPGNHTYTFDGKNLASGIYYYQLVAGEYREVKKMIILR